MCVYINISGGNGGVPEGSRVVGAGGQQGRLGYGMKAQVYERVLSGIGRAGSRGEQNCADLKSACGDIHEAAKVQ